MPLAIQQQRAHGLKDLLAGRHSETLEPWCRIAAMIVSKRIERRTRSLNMHALCERNHGIDLFAGLVSFSSSRRKHSSLIEQTKVGAVVILLRRGIRLFTGIRHHE